MSEPQDPNRPGQQQLNIELSEEIAEGEYSNLVMIAHSAEEFILDFIRVVPGVAKAKVKTRIIISPSHAKRLLAALADNVKRYEAANGPIAATSQPNPGVQFGGPSGEA